MASTEPRPGQASHVEGEKESFRGGRGGGGHPGLDEERLGGMSQARLAPYMALAVWCSLHAKR